MLFADYSNTGMGVVGVAAPGGDYVQGVDAVQTGILAAASSSDTSQIWPAFDVLNDTALPGLTVLNPGARYVTLTGTSMAPRRRSTPPATRPRAGTSPRRARAGRRR